MKQLKVDCSCEIVMEYANAQMTDILNSLRQANKFCDGVIRTQDGGEFPIHRAILAACSPYFRALFTNVICDTENSVVTIPDVTADIMSLVIDFAYTGKHCAIYWKNGIT